MAANLAGFQLFHQSDASASNRKLIIKMVDATDGFTEETGITFASGDVKLSKNGGAFANTTNLPSEVAFGSYVLELTSTEINTVGAIEVRATKAGSRNFYMFGQVIGFDILDSNPNVGSASSVSGDVGGDILGNVTSFGSSALTDIEDQIWGALVGDHGITDSFGQRFRGIAPQSGAVSDAGPTATDFDTNLTQAVDDFWKDALIVFYEGPLLGQARTISDYDGTSKNITVSPAFTGAPSNGNRFIIISAGARGAALSATLAELAQAKPSATPTLEQCLMLLYMTARNKVITASGEQKLHDDAGTVIAKAALSFAAGTFTREELESGP